jgi:hypothetical protein
MALLADGVAKKQTGTVGIRTNARGVDAYLSDAGHGLPLPI